MLIESTTSHVSICSLFRGVQWNLSKKIADCVDKTLYQYKIISLEIHHYFKWLCIQDLNCIYLGQELGRVSRKVWR